MLRWRLASAHDTGTQAAAHLAHGGEELAWGVNSSMAAQAERLGVRRADPGRRKCRAQGKAEPRNNAQQAESCEQKAGCAGFLGVCLSHTRFLACAVRCAAAGVSYGSKILRSCAQYVRGLRLAALGYGYADISSEYLPGAAKRRRRKYEIFI